MQELLSPGSLDASPSQHGVMFTTWKLSKLATIGILRRLSHVGMINY